MGLPRPKRERLLGLWSAKVRRSFSRHPADAVQSVCNVIELIREQMAVEVERHARRGMPNICWTTFTLPLAVFVAGSLIGDPGAPYKREVERFHSALAGLAEIVAFLVLGLTVDITLAR